MAIKERSVSEDARKVLMGCLVEDDAIVIPADRQLGGANPLSRPLYQEVNGILESLGGKWHKGKRKHLFTSLNGEELAEAFYEIAESGRWTDGDALDFFPTPPSLVKRMIDLAFLEDGQKVLEPSAGEGAILEGISEVGHAVTVTAVEFDPRRANLLKTRALDLRLNLAVYTGDFLAETWGPFDRVLMNPPFGKGAAVKHVRHAISALRSGGRLVAIMPSSIVQRQDRAHRELRQEIMRHGSFHPVEAGAFKASGTMANTVLVFYEKPSQAQQESQPAIKPAETATEPGRRFRRLGGSR